MEAATSRAVPLPVLDVQGIRRHFRMGSQEIDVLRGAGFTLAEGEILAIVGQSGSGKSTLLHQVALLDRPDSGEIFFRGELLPTGGDRAARARNRLFGFVFQFYHLLPDFNALENVIMPAMIMEGWRTFRRHRTRHRERAAALLERFGLRDRMKHRPPQLSGGERQRVAIARALMNAPPILLCDEPTGNLDRETSDGVRDLLWDLNRTEQQSMVVVTHDFALASRADRTLELVDGILREHMVTT